MKCLGRFKIQALTHCDANVMSTRTTAGQFKCEFKGAMERYTWVRFAGKLTACHRTHIAKVSTYQWGLEEMLQEVSNGKHTAQPPVMSNPISSAVPPDCIKKTRRPPLASSTTLPGTSASIVRARLMQIADPLHMLLVNSYVPAATKILSTALLLTAAVSSATLLTETSFSFRPCSTRGAERARPSFTIRPVGMLATAMDRWTRLKSTLRICHAGRVVPSNASHTCAQRTQGCACDPTGCVAE